MELWTQRSRLLARRERRRLASGRPPTFDADTLLTRLFAVHLALDLPRTGRLVAGSYLRSAPRSPLRAAWLGGEPPAGDRRVTIHWSLGACVPEFEGAFDAGDERYAWRRRRTAVVAPLAALERRLVSVNAYDTVTLGDFELDDPRCVLVAPLGAELDALPRGISVRRYDASRELLADEVGRVIAAAGGWRLELPSTGHLGSPAFFHRRQVNQPEFFAPILRRHPHVSFGTHLASPVGEGFLLGGMDSAFAELLGHYFYRLGGLHFPQPTATIALRLALARACAEGGAAFIDAHPAPLEVRTSCLRKIAEGADWLDAVAADLELRARHRRTFAGARPEQVERVALARDEPTRLRALLEEMRGALPRCDPERGRDLVPIDESAASLPVPELRALLARAGLQPGDGSPGARVIWFLFLARRYKIVGSERARAESLDRELERALASIEGGRPRRRALELLFPLLGSALAHDSTLLGDALALLRLPALAAGLERELGMRLPHPGLRSLQAVLRAHPATRGLFEPGGETPADPRSLDEVLLSFDTAAAHAASRSPASA